MADPTPGSNSYSPFRDVSFSAAGAVTEHATIGPSIVIKGDVSGSEALFVEGTVEGSIHIPSHRVTIGRTSHVTADVHSQDVVVMGSVKGNIYAADLLDIRADSFIQGKMIAQRIRIDDGAVLKGSVEVHSAKPKAENFEVAASKPAETAGIPAAVSAEKTEPTPARREGAAAAMAAHAARRVPGSSTLLEIEK